MCDFSYAAYYADVKEALWWARTMELPVATEQIGELWQKLNDGKEMA